MFRRNIVCFLNLQGRKICQTGKQTRGLVAVTMFVLGFDPEITISRNVAKPQQAYTTRTSQKNPLWFESADMNKFCRLLQVRGGFRERRFNAWHYHVSVYLLTCLFTLLRTVISFTTDALIFLRFCLNFYNLCSRKSLSSSSRHLGMAILKFLVRSGLLWKMFLASVIRTVLKTCVKTSSFSC
jgi:hypothetical protein